MRRPDGTGTIERRKAGWYARLPRRWGRKRLGPYATEEEARAELAAELALLAGVDVVRGERLGLYGRTWLEDRIASGHYRAAKRELLRWAQHVEPRDLGALALEAVDAPAIRRWLASLRGADGARVAPKTQRHALALVRAALQHAVDTGALERNPAESVTVPRAAIRSSGEGDRWTWLTAAELDRVLAASCLLPHECAILTVAAFTGARAGELWALRWESVDFERGMLRLERAVSEQGIGPTKSGRAREIPILPRARAALLDERSRTGDGPIVFRSYRSREHTTGYSARLAEALAEARITRRVRFHDLRHTFASLAVQGQLQGLPPMRLEDIRQWLGHADLAMTMRYAHLAPEGLARFASPAPGVAPAGAGTRETSHFLMATPTGIECQAVEESEPAPIAPAGGRGSLVDHARATLEAIAEGRSDAYRLATELAVAVLAIEARRAKELVG